MADAPLRAFYVREPGDEPGTEILSCYLSRSRGDAEVADARRVDPAERAGEPLLAVRWRAGERRVLRVVVGAHAAAGAPPLWYAAVAEPEADPPAMNLVAFADGAHPDGTVLQAGEVHGRPEQAAALRWFFLTGQLHQIYVQPAWRRRHVATKLTYAATGYRAAHGWPLLFGTGERTDLGEAWAAGAPEFWRGRYGPRTRVMAPMTPAEPASPRVGR